MEELFRLPLWSWGLFVAGACIGSYLNVVIYRWPREGLSVTSPSRSFCPICEEEIPWYRNIPLLTWLLQRGKCASCGAPISVRYPCVELLTAVLFMRAWDVFVVDRNPISPIAALLVATLAVLLVTIAWIDADLMLVPVDFCWWGMGIGVFGACLAPTLVALLDVSDLMIWWEGGMRAAVGIAAGWGGLSLVVYLGKKLMGIKRIEFSEATEWCLREPESEEEQLSFVIRDAAGARPGLEKEEDVYPWGDLFFRDYDCLEIEGHGVQIDGRSVRAKTVRIRRETVEAGGQTYSIEEMKSLSGKATRVAVPREAMGDGDPPLLGLIGAFIGWQGVVFALFAGCMFAILWALPARVGFGRQLPFGPFLALGGAAWIFGGWSLWEWYFGSLIQIGADSR